MAASLVKLAMAYGTTMNIMANVKWEVAYERWRWS